MLMKSHKVTRDSQVTKLEMEGLGNIEVVDSALCRRFDTVLAPGDF